MTLQTFDIKYNSVFISMHCSFFHIVYKKGGETAPAPLTDDEMMINYWKNLKIQKEKE